MERFLLLIVTILCMSISAEGFTLIHRDDTPHGLLENGQQSVHTETHIVYANPGDTLRMYRPERMAFTGYIRWYCYDTDSAAQGIIHNGYTVSAWGDEYTISNEKGLFKRKWGKSGSTSRQSTPNLHYYEVDYIMHSGDSVYRIAVDESIYTDYIPGGNSDWRKDKITTLTEPTLSKRIIYEMHPASEIASRIDTCVGDVFLEEHEIIAPTGRQLYIGPDYRFRCKDEGQQVYQWKSHSNYYYNESSPVQMYEKKDWIWEIDGVNTAINMISSQYIEVSCPTPGTHTYELKFNAGGTYYNIAKFTITYFDVASVGPVENLPAPTTKMSLIYENTFNYDEPGVTNMTFWNGNLGAEESTYGYYFENLRAYRDHHNDEPNWCEYGIVNSQDIYGSSSMVYNHVDSTENVSENAKKGYMIFVDGSQQPGQVFNLKVNADLCPGSRMYFSAWLIDASPRDNKKCAPNMDFIVVGVDDNQGEHILTTFTTGEFGCNAKEDVNKNGNMKNGVWYQIMFPVDIDASEIYQTYRLNITNKGKSADGNDFAIDDIRIYVQKPPVTPIQASTYDCPSSSSDSITAYLRVDFQAIDQTQNTFYYQWRDENNEIIETDYYGGNNSYGVVDIPASESAIIASGDTCSSLLSFDAQYYNTDTSVIKYIKERVDAETERYIMYIAQPLYVKTNYTYTGFVAIRQSDLGDKGGCGTYADLMVAGGTRILINGEALGDSVVSLCGQRSYTLDIVLTYVTQNISTGELEERNTPCRADWLIGDSAFVNENKELYSGASFNEIEAAIMNHRKNGPDSLVLKLVKNNLLTLDTATTNMQPAKSLSYTAFPVDGSAGQMAVCLTPRFLHINPSDTIKNMMAVGGEDDDLPESVKLTPRRIRVSESQIKQGSFNLPVYPSGDGGVYYVIDSVRLISTTNPNWQAEIVLNGKANEDTIETSDTIYIWGAELQNLEAGYDYTFHVSFKDEDEGCDRGYTYFILRVVPDVVTWYGGNWNEDVNWSSFIPLPETNVILLSQDYNVTFTDDTIYDINYVKNQCNSIYLPVGSSMAGQEKITINGQAYIDIQEYAWKWDLTSIPLKGVVSGDMFVNQEESTDPFTVNPIHQTVGAFAADRYIFEVYQSEFDKATNKWKLSTNSLDKVYEPGEAKLVGIDCESSDMNPVIRLPKVDFMYRYFEKYGHYWMGEAEYITRITEYGKPTFNGDTVITLKETYDYIYLFGNPTFGYVDITKLVQDNSDRLTGRYYTTLGGISKFPTEIVFVDELDATKSEYHVLLPPTRGILLEGQQSSNTLTINVTPNIINEKGRVPLRRAINTDITTDIPTVNVINLEAKYTVFDIYGNNLGNRFECLPKGFYILKYENHVKKVYKVD